MTYCPQFIVFLVSIAAFSQLSPTTAFSQQCIDGTLQFAVTAGVNYDALRKLILDKCDGTNNCDVDLTDWSTNGLGGQQFASMCDAVNGTTFDGTDSDGEKGFLYADCTSFNVGYPGVHLCAPAGCEFSFKYDDALYVWGVMFENAGFDGECSDFAALYVPIGVVVAIVVVLILICVGVGTYVARRRRKSLPY